MITRWMFATLLGATLLPFSGGCVERRREVIVERRRPVIVEERRVVVEPRREVIIRHDR